MINLTNFLRSLLMIGLISLSFLVSLSLVIDLMLDRKSELKIFSSVEEIPYKKVGLLLGTSKYVVSNNGLVINPYFKYRIDAAYKLYKAKKVKYLLVSGDNREVDYNEPERMKQSLIKLGVKPEHIFPDYGGRRTLDSVIRAKEIFGLTNFTIISQNFHNKRAIFLSDYLGINAIAYNAKDISRNDIRLYTNLRERMARIKAILDIMFRVDAKIKGKPIQIPV